MAYWSRAIRHAISRALSELDPENRKVLKANGLITRDARKKERKLYGQKGARARSSFPAIISSYNGLGSSFTHGYDLFNMRTVRWLKRLTM